MATTQPAPVQRARYSQSPTLAESTAPTSSYSFPPPPSHRPSTADNSARDHASSPAPLEYTRPRTGDANFSYTSQPGSHSRDDGDDEDSVRQPLPEGYQQPRSMSIAGLAEDSAYLEGLQAGSSAAKAAAAATSEAMHGHPSSAEYSALGRAVVQGGPVQRVMAGYQFAEYMGGEEGPSPSSSGMSRYPAYPPHYRPYTFGTATPPPGHPFARGPASYNVGPPGPPLEWAKPRASQDDSAIGMTSRQYASSGPHTPRYGSSAPQGVYYAAQPYHPGAMGMARTTSNQSGLSAYTDSTEASHATSASSSYESHINPSYLSAYMGGGGESGYYSSPSAGDLHGVSGLRIDASPVLGASASSSSSARRTRSGAAKASRANSHDLDDKYATLRSTATASGAKPRKRIASRIFHPSPQSMLAPGATHPSAGALAAAKRGSAHFPGTNSPALPSDAEFAKMPTKRSRGRRPPCTPDLDLDPDAIDDPNAQPTDAQLAWVGTTKTGKPRKVFVCKVPGCGKCFKRSEHLKRHVRSIHTNEKPFQCQWPGCKRLFSRHDNLNQHLRIHREPGISDEDFSAALRDYFGSNSEAPKRARRAAPRQASEERDDLDEFDGGDEDANDSDY
ncbi:hypothetical protein JCM10207_007935 [Rhodosporidiobolus poonsookiae]